MPVYEYICDDCGAGFSVLVPSHKSKVACTGCGSAKLTRQFSTFSAHGGGPGSALPCAPGTCPGGGGGPQASCADGRCPFT